MQISFYHIAPPCFDATYSGVPTRSPNLIYVSKIQLSTRDVTCTSSPDITNSPLYTDKSNIILIYIHIYIHIHTYFSFINPQNTTPLKESRCPPNPNPPKAQPTPNPKTSSRRPHWNNTNNAPATTAIMYQP